MPRALSLGLVATLVAAVAPTISARVQRAESPDGCTWLAGDLHVHTTYSHDSYGGPNDDNTGPNEAYTLGHSTQSQFAVAASRDLDYLAITDHNDVRSIRDFGSIQTDGVVPVSGYEKSLKGHAQMLGATKVYEGVHDEDPDSVAAVADQLRAEGGVFQINHPAERKTSGDIHGDMDWGYGFQVEPDTVEVWNISRLWQPPMPSASSNDDAVRYWEEWLDRGVKVAATGGSDNHYVSTTPVQGVGQPTTWVCAPERSQAGVLSGLRAGHTFISHQPPAYGGPKIFLESAANETRDPLALTQTEGDTIVGETAPHGQELRVRVVGAPGSLLRIYSNNHTQEGPDIPVTSPAFEYRFTPSASATWVRAEIIEPDGAEVRRQLCDGIVGGQTTYCRNQLLVLGMTSALFISPAQDADPSPSPEPQPGGTRLPDGEFLVGANKISLEPTPERYRPNGQPRIDESQQPAHWETDEDLCELVPNDGGRERDPGDYQQWATERLSEPHAFVFPEGKTGWPGRNPNCIYLGGYGIGPIRSAEGVDEKFGVWVRSVAISNGVDTAIFQVIDTVGYFARYREDVCHECGLKDVREAISEELQLGGSEHVSIASTHTHAGADGYGGWGGLPRWYYHQMRDSMIESARTAYDEMQRARISVGAVDAREFNNQRRKNYWSVSDYGAVWLQARPIAGGDAIATMTNYAAHPVTKGFDNEVLHPDWHGPFNKAIEESFGGVALSIQGGLGNISPENGYDADGLAGLVAEDVTEGGTQLTRNTIAALQSEIVHPTTNAPEFALAAAGMFDREFVPGTEGAAGPGTYSWSKQDESPQRGCHTAGPAQIRTVVSGYRIGELNIFTGPGELFSNITKVVKSYARSGTQTMVLSQANDSLGYIIQSFEFDPIGGTPQTSAGIAEYEETFALDRCFGDHVLQEMLDLNRALPQVDPRSDQASPSPEPSASESADASPSPSATESADASPSPSASESADASPTPGASQASSASPSAIGSNPPPSSGGSSPSESSSAHATAAGVERETISTSLAANRQRARAGTRITFTGQLTGPRTCSLAREVMLSRRVFGSETFDVVRTALAGADGQWSVALRALRGASYHATPSSDTSCEGVSS
ncbi:MAG: CehA/McbA family metallohydrolase, partial [Actinomycetota bacterium]|nr:CehA/McbA family metallohydrolase [Actinomycetota bacterium]